MTAGTISATGASPGAVAGEVFAVRSQKPVVPDFDDPAAAFTEAAAAVKADLEALRSRAAEGGREEAAAILGAQSLMADDPMLSSAVLEALEAGADLGGAIDQAAGSISSMLAAMDDPYLAARSADVLEIADRIRHRLAGTSGEALAEIGAPVIVVARVLTAADTAQLDPDLVLGFVTEEGGPTSHVAVIARALGIPAVVGAAGVADQAATASQIAIDGTTGEVVLDPSADVLADYARRVTEADEARRVAEQFRGTRVRFAGRPLFVTANVGTPDDIARAVDVAADGVGLFRTEFLFLDRDTPPTEDEQYEVYRHAVSSFQDPVVIRTLDIGGDKPAAYLDTPVEENPFLGERGVRLYDRFPELFGTQARALLRAASAGELWIMIPMVATVEDLLGVRAAFDAARAQLDSEAASYGSPKLGIMVEVPSAAVIAPQLARHADFFSIGTNDLTQYTLAADRTNGRLAGYSEAAHPAVVGLCHITATAARQVGISVSVCGESASDPHMAALFAAMGMDKLSVAPPSVNRIKAVIASLDESQAARALDEALTADSPEQVRAIVQTQLGVA